MVERPSTGLMFVLGIALALRLGWGLTRSTDDASLSSLPDQLEYVELGRNLAAGRGLVMHDSRLDVDVRAFRSPGYPAFVAVCGGGDVRTIRIVQAVLDTLSVLAVFRMARHWLGPRPGLAAAAIVAVNPFLVYFSALVLSETLFIALLSWGMCLISAPCPRTSKSVQPSGDDTRHACETNLGHAPPLRVRVGRTNIDLGAPMFRTMGCLLLALSVTVRPGAIGLALLLAPASAMLVPRGAGRLRSAVLRAGMCGVITFLVLLPWGWRNRSLLGTWVWTTTNAGFTFYDGFNPGATGASNQAFVGTMREELRSLDSEVARSRRLSTLAVKWITEHPARAAALAVAKIARTWSPAPLSAEYGGDMRLQLVSLAYAVPLFSLVGWGLLSSRTGLCAAAKVFLLVPAIYFTFAHALSVGSMRYRLPADLPMAIVAAGAISTIGNDVHRRQVTSG